MDDFAGISSIALISLLAAMSPGPDFALVTKSSLSGNFRTGFLTALGVSCALLIHVTYCLFGIALLIQQSPLLFQCLKYLGAVYLFYLGIVLLKEKKASPEGAPSLAKVEIKKKRRSFSSGFLCNLLNPKATLFVLSLFTQFIDPSMAFWKKAVMGSIIAIVAFIWFVLLVYLITHRLLQKHFAKFQFLITKTMGIVLCLLAIYVAIRN